jgi:hypothetical protein
LNIQTNETTAATIDASQNVSFTNGVNLPNTFGFKNRLINGQMLFDQRNAGASVTAADNAYTLDRWKCFLSVASKFTVQQNAGSVTPPSGFVKYLGATSSAATSVGASDYYVVTQVVEGSNISDLNWGTASASSVSVSFWVRSSLTGLFGGALTNGNTNYSYAFSYTISAANTWEYKTVTIAGPTSGTWSNDTSSGVGVRFSLGAGSNYSAAAGSWTASNLVSCTGATNVISTSGATLYITGVQLEKGTQATSFDFRSYGTELALCQRYYYKLSSNSANATTFMSPGVAYNTTQSAQHYCGFPATMRTAPTASIGGSVVLYVNASTNTITSIATQNCSPTQGTLNFNVAAGLTAGTYYIPICQNTTAYFDFSAEL